MVFPGSANKHPSTSSFFANPRTIYKDWFGIWTRILLLADLFKMNARLVRALRREGRHANLLQPRRLKIFPWLLQPRPGYIHEEYQDQGRHYVPKPGPDYIHEECQDQDRRYQAQHAQPFLCVGARLVHTSEIYQEKWGQAPLRSTLRDSIARAQCFGVPQK